jgi:spoIIIJ-associated protein
VEDQKAKLDTAKIEWFLQTVIESAGFGLKFKIGPAENLHPDFENPEIVVAFTGHDVDLLLSNKAELLLALEQITMEVLRLNQNEHSLLQFDANDYRMLRIEELRLSALTAAEKVKRSKLPFEFNPMNSRERRIIHLALRNEADVRSESMGAGPYRQVIVYPAGMPSLPAKPQPTGPPPRRPQGGPPPRRSGGPGRRP